MSLVVSDRYYIENKIHRRIGVQEDSLLSKTENS
jgi:hypothetical protein